MEQGIGMTKIGKQLSNLLTEYLSSADLYDDDEEIVKQLKGDN